MNTSVYMLSCTFLSSWMAKSMRSELLVQILHWSKWTKGWVQKPYSRKLSMDPIFMDDCLTTKIKPVKIKSMKIKLSSDWTRPLNMLTDTHAYLDVGTVQPWLSEPLWPAPQSKCSDEPKSLDNQVYVWCTVNHAHSHKFITNLLNESMFHPILAENNS